MANKFGLIGIVSGILAVASVGINANAQQPNVSVCAPSTRIVQESLLREFRPSFYYDLSSERGYSVPYFASVNDNKSCRLGNVNKIYPRDIQLQLVEKGLSGESHYWRIIQLLYFLDQTKEYDVAVIDSDGKERALDEIKPGDRGLRFYGPVIRIPGEKKILKVKPRT